jgi:hypothetical protein
VADDQRERLLALMEEHFPRLEPRVQRSPNRYGDDPAVDARDDQRSAIEDFIDVLSTLTPVQPAEDARCMNTLVVQCWAACHLPTGHDGDCEPGAPDGRVYGAPVEPDPLRAGVEALVNEWCVAFTEDRYFPDDWSKRYAHAVQDCGERLRALLAKVQGPKPAWWPETTPWTNPETGESLPPMQDWLAAHDREVAAKAWDEGRKAIREGDTCGDVACCPEPTTNPYR